MTSDNGVEKEETVDRDTKDINLTMSSSEGFEPFWVESWPQTAANLTGPPFPPTAVMQAPLMSWSLASAMITVVKAGLVPLPPGNVLSIVPLQL